MIHFILYSNTNHKENMVIKIVHDCYFVVEINKKGFTVKS